MKLLLVTNSHDFLRNINNKDTKCSENLLLAELYKCNTYKVDDNYMNI